MPVRFFEGQLIIAIGEASRAKLVAEESRCTGFDVKCVVASPVQIETALAKYYPDLASAN
jgi:hypothetical protein